ncbi:MAG: tripartite tricarboxylate transporter substrate-binding protein, partial [Sheuella sp.]|nr:tripartite tricarboxylate transporter substrate-binding protein [Sheuella sp.]
MVSTWSSHDLLSGTERYIRPKEQDCHPLSACLKNRHHLSNQMGQKLGQSFIVENRPGASSDIAARSVATSAADGYTLFILTIANI